MNAGAPARAAEAMAAVERELILPHDGLALLFTPPFDKTPLDPGYNAGPDYDLVSGIGVPFARALIKAVTNQ